MQTAGGENTMEKSTDKVVDYILFDFGACPVSKL